MAVQYACEICGDLWPENSLIALDGKLICSSCITLVVQDLRDKIAELECELSQYFTWDK